MLKQLIKRVRNWEQWPFKVLYAPLVPVWAYYMLRSRAVWFFTPSNPKLTFGGMEGEPKREMYDLLPPEYCPITFNVLPSESFDTVKQRIAQHGVTFPLIAKPEVGGQGILVRKLDTEDQLRHYHKHVPAEYIIQEWVQYPYEVSVFYYRLPSEPSGVVTGFLHKIPLEVIGDGIHTLRQLIEQHPKAAKRMQELELHHSEAFNRVVPEGQPYKLSYAANHNRGARFIDLADKIDDKLVKVFDGISHSIDDFFYGRYDIMCNSIEELKEGNNFKILEYNGCGAEPNHFYDTEYTLVEAYAEILKHWRALYKISTYNRRKGIKPWPYRKGADFMKQSHRHYALLRKAEDLIP